MTEAEGLQQAWAKPRAPRPIVIIGSGGIVNDAHLPAYEKAGFSVAGVFDVDSQRSAATAKRWGIGRVYDSVEQAAGETGVVFDVAVPPGESFSVLKRLPEQAVVLIQKPMGEDLADARRIRAICREKKLTAAVNFQLRFSPAMLAIRDAIGRGMLGRVLELELRLNLRTPWELFPFVKKLKHVEIPTHSVHYLDWIRSVLGEPTGVYARTVGHPVFADLADVRTSAILDYGDQVRCCLSINHVHTYGNRHAAAEVRVEGDRGCAWTKLGLLLNYPKGEPDELELADAAGKWTSVELAGRWFPDAFIGTMANVQRFASGEDEQLVSSVEDAYRTMAVMEACQRSSAEGATPIPE